MEGTIGEIRLFAAPFSPKNWWYCDGSIIAIRSNTALFAILGTTYGGDGQTTFALPNLAGRSAVGSGQGDGLSYYALGERIGTNNVTLNIGNLPTHTHSASGSIVVPAYSESGDAASPANNVLASKPSMYSTQPSDGTTKAIPMQLQIANTGGNQAIGLNKPSIGMNYIVCMTGVFPYRN